VAAPGGAPTGGGAAAGEGAAATGRGPSGDGAVTSEPAASGGAPSSAAPLDSPARPPALRPRPPREPRRRRLPDGLGTSSAVPPFVSPPSCGTRSPWTRSPCIPAPWTPSPARPRSGPSAGPAGVGLPAGGVSTPAGPPGPPFVAGPGVRVWPCSAARSLPVGLGSPGSAGWTEVVSDIGEFPSHDARRPACGALVAAPGCVRRADTVGRAVAQNLLAASPPPVGGDRAGENLAMTHRRPPQSRSRSARGGLDGAAGATGPLGEGRHHHLRRPRVPRFSTR